MISELGKILKQNKNIEFWYLLVWCKFYYNLPDEALMEVFTETLDIYKKLSAVNGLYIVVYYEIFSMWFLVCLVFTFSSYISLLFWTFVS